MEKRYRNKIIIIIIIINLETNLQYNVHTTVLDYGVL